MTPEEIAKWIDPQGRGLIIENLYGYPVKPGTTPIDDLIAAVEANWLDWDPKDPKFQKLVTKVLGVKDMPPLEVWQKLFSQSVQSDELKGNLLARLGGQEPGLSPAVSPTAQKMPGSLTISAARRGTYQNPGTNFPTGSGRFRIHFKRGTVVKAIAVLRGNPRTMTFYAALRPNKKVTSVRGGFGSNGRDRPRAFAHRKGKKWYWDYDVITFKPTNVRMVEVL
jgi:hypothetical protein